MEARNGSKRGNSVTRIEMAIRIKSLLGFNRFISSSLMSLGGIGIEQDHTQTQRARRTDIIKDHSDSRHVNMETESKGQEIFFLKKKKRQKKTYFTVRCHIPIRQKQNKNTLFSILNSFQYERRGYSLYIQ